MKSFVRAMDKVNKVVELIVVILFVIAFLTIVYQVIGRSMLNISLPWTEELARYLVVYIVYFAASLAARANRLTRLEVLIAALKLSNKGRKVIDIIASIAAIIFYVIAAICVMKTAGLAKTQLSPAMKIPMYIPYIGVQIGCVLLIINTIIPLFDSNPDDRIGGISE